MKQIILIGFLFLSYPSYSNESKDILRIIDKDRSSGVEATIKKITVDEKKFTVSRTGKDGYILKEFECSLLEKIKIEPKDTNYYKRDVDCPIADKTIALRSAKYEYILLSNAQISFDDGDFGTAALAYNEIAARVGLAGDEGGTQSTLVINTYKSAGKYLEVAEATWFDPQQNKVVMSENLQAAIIGLQKEKGLKETGQLDFKTLESISNKKLGEVLFTEIQAKNSEQ